MKKRETLRERAEREARAEARRYFARCELMFGKGWLEEDDEDDNPIFPEGPLFPDSSPDSKEDTPDEIDYDQRAKDENRAKRFGDLDR